MNDSEMGFRSFVTGGEEKILVVGGARLDCHQAVYMSLGVFVTVLQVGTGEVIKGNWTLRPRGRTHGWSS